MTEFGSKVVAPAIGWAIAGAVGAAVADHSNGAPVLKAAAATAAIGAGLGLVYYAATATPKQVGTSGTVYAPGGLVARFP